MLVAIHLARKEKEAALILFRLKTQSVIHLPGSEAPAEQPILSLVFFYPNYCVDPGSDLVRNSSILSLLGRFVTFLNPERVLKFWKLLSGIGPNCPGLVFPARPTGGRVHYGLSICYELSLPRR